MREIFVTHSTPKLIETMYDLEIWKEDEITSIVVEMRDGKKFKIFGNKTDKFFKTIKLYDELHLISSQDKKCLDFGKVINKKRKVDKIDYYFTFKEENHKPIVKAVKW